MKWGAASIVCHVAIAEMLLYEVGLSDMQLSTQYITLTDRLEILWGCLNASKTFLDTRFAPHTSEQPRFICLSASDFLYAFILSLRLSNLKVPGWDLDMVRRHIAVNELVEKQIHEMETRVERRKRGKFYGAVSAPTPGGAGAGSQADGNPDSMVKLTAMLKCLKSTLQSELDRYDAQTLPADNPLPPDANRAFIADLDNTFWQDLLTQPPWSAFDSPSNIDWMAFVNQ